MSNASWSHRCIERLSQIDVRPFDPKDASDWEAELFQLTGRRGLPVFTRAKIGSDTAPDGDGVLEQQVSGMRLTCFAWSPDLGTIDIEVSENATARRALWARSRPGWVAHDWRDFIERLVVLEGMPPFPPGFVLLDPWKPGGRSNLRDRFVPALRMSPEMLRTPRHPFWVGAETLVLDGYPYEVSHKRVYTPDAKALITALQTAEATELPWFFPTVEVPLGKLSNRVGAIAGSCRRSVEHTTLRVTIGDDVIRQEVEVLGILVETTEFSQTGATRELGYGPPLGSTRVAAWALHRGVVRCPVVLDEASVLGWLKSRRMPRWPALVECERAFGGLLATGSYAHHDADPLCRPRVILGLRLIKRAPERLVACWSTAIHDPDEPLVGMSNFLEPPRAIHHLLWGWRQHTFIFVGEWTGRYLFCDQNGAIWCHHDEAGDLDVIAGSPRTLLEQIAIKEELWREMPAHITVHVFADTGALVAQRLGLKSVGEATDDLIQTYEGGGILIQQRRAYGPNFLEMRVVSRELEGMVRAVREARELCPDVVVRVWNRSIEATAHVDALVKAGIGAKEDFDGPGVGEPTRFPSNANDEESDEA